MCLYHLSFCRCPKLFSVSAWSYAVPTTSVFHIVFETLHRQRCFIHPETIPYGHLKRGTGGMGGNMNQNETNQNAGEKGQDTLHRPATQQAADPSTRINQTDAHDGAKTNTQKGAN